MKGEGQGLDSPDIVYYYCRDQNNISAVANPAKVLTANGVKRLYAI